MKPTMIIIIMLFITALAFAHPAGKVSSSYDAKTQLLTVTYEHKVRDAADHFINAIFVQVNGKEAIRQNVSRQESLEGGSFIYKLISLKKGDKITVITECNKGGKKNHSLTIQ